MVAWPRPQRRERQKETAIIIKSCIINIIVVNAVSDVLCIQNTQRPYRMDLLRSASVDSINENPFSRLRAFFCFFSSLSVAKYFILWPWGHACNRDHSDDIVDTDDMAVFGIKSISVTFLKNVTFNHFQFRFKSILFWQQAFSESESD